MYITFFFLGDFCRLIFLLFLAKLLLNRPSSPRRNWRLLGKTLTTDFVGASPDSCFCFLFMLCSRGKPFVWSFALCPS